MSILLGVYFNLICCDYKMTKIRDKIKVDKGSFIPYNFPYTILANL